MTVLTCLCYFQKTSTGAAQVLAQKLWDSGMKSLKFMLGMYDTGAGTLYDLRHVINHEPPNRARWDYHVTHIALIHEMAIVDGDPIFWEAWARWKGYLKGIRSHHNWGWGTSRGVWLRMYNLSMAIIKSVWVVFLQHLFVILRYKCRIWIYESRRELLWL